MSIKYSERLAEAGIEPSVGSVGDSNDNALAETINGLYKAEVIHRRGPWRNFEAVEFATLEWVDWFNNRRLLEPIGNIPPAEAEERYYAMLDAPKPVRFIEYQGISSERTIFFGRLIICLFVFLFLSLRALLNEIHFFRGNKNRDRLV